MPEEEFYKEEPKNEEEEIKELAKIGVKLELYAYRHKDEIEGLKEQIEELRKKEKTEENREELLQKIESLETRYKVFGRYIKDEEWEGLYRTKFDILMSDINKRQESPLAEVVDETAYEKEIPTYSKIIEEKIEAIVKGENPELKRAFGEKAPEAVKIIKKKIHGKEKEYNTYDILKDKYILELILAFDKKKGLEDIKIKNISSFLK